MFALQCTLTWLEGGGDKENERMMTREKWKSGKEIKKRLGGRHIFKMNNHEWERARNLEAT